MTTSRKRTCILAACTSLPFLGAAVVVIADANGHHAFGKPLRFHDAILFDLFLLWAALFALMLAVVERRRLLAFLRAKWKHCVLAGATTLFCLAVVEIVLRIVVPPLTLPHYDTPFSRAYHHIHAPRVKMFGGVFDGSAVVVETNEDGLRTPYSRAEFQKFTDRVVVLGDSFAMGYGVQGGEAFPAVLERELRWRLNREDIGVLDAGIVSYSPVLERNLFDRLIVDYKPTLTLMCIDVTDIGDDDQYMKSCRIAEDGRISFEIGERGMKRNWYDGIALAKEVEDLGRELGHPFSLVRELVREAPREDRFNYYSFAVRVGGVIETNRFFILRHPLSETEPFFRVSWGHIERTAESAARAGSPFMLVVLPRYVHWNDRECPGNWEAKDYRNDEPYENEYLRFFDEAGKDAPFDVFGLLPAFQQSKEFPLVFPSDPHWNRKGHELAGRALAEHISGRYLH